MLSGHLTKGLSRPESPRAITPGSGEIGHFSLNGNESLLSITQTASSHPTEDGSGNMDWYELFNMEGDDFLGLAGSLTNPDYLNPQNLEFLYRFL